MVKNCRELSRPAAASWGILNANLLQRRRRRPPKKVMNATHFDVSLTPLSTIGPGQVTLEVSTWELFDHPEICSDPAGVDRMSGRCFWPYIQDPPVVLAVTARSAII